MIAKRTIAGSALAVTCLMLSTCFASAGDFWAAYESKVKNAKACVRRQAGVYAAGAQGAEQAARAAFAKCEHLYKQGIAAHAKAAGLVPKEADIMMAAVRRAVIREIIEVISATRQGRPVSNPSLDPDAQ